MYCCDFTIYDMIARNAGLYPEKKAIVYGDNRISFSDYQTLCDQCTAGLVKEGVKIGDRIAILSSNCDEFMILCGAAAKIGAIVVPVNYRLVEAEVEYILKDTTPNYIFSSEEYKDLANKAMLTVDSIQKHYVFTSDKNEGDFIPFRTLLLNEKIMQSDAVSGNNAYMIIHTAAVGGKPRGCVLSQTNMLAVGLQMAHMFKFTSSDCHIGTLPLFHIGGFATTLGVMHQGGNNVIMDRFDPLLVLKLTGKEQGTFFGTFPPMLAAVLDAQDKQSIDTPSLRGAGWMDSPDNIERFLKKNSQATFYSLYGQAEAMPVSGCDTKEKPGSIGVPAIMTRVAIFDDLDREVPVGGQGEICVRSPSVFLGYWNLEADTAYTFRNGWHHTGDRGRMDEEGYLYYGGRNPEKELIKPGGENVYPAEVEKVILIHGCVEEVAVIGVPDSEWGEAVLAVCVLKKGTDVGAAELIEFVASKIARYKKPRHVLFVESLPKTASGEINREEVKKTYSGKK
jgi:acyl-CoA synthetase (AMP-forming)/AMP-acid ligase II